MRAKLEACGARDIQNDHVRGYLGEHAAILDALNSLWDDFCAESSAWPVRAT